jgi:hypothetical protein
LAARRAFFGGFSYYQLVIIFFNIVPLILEFIANDPKMIDICERLEETSRKLMKENG